MLRLDDVHVYYGLGHVLQGVSMEVRPGEVVGLFGRNGVGKTTTIKTIAGWVAPRQGSIELDGAAIGGLTPDQVSRHGVALVPEDRRIFPALSTEENLEMGWSLCRGMTKAQRKAKLEEVYERFPRLAQRRRQPGTTLSGGEQQMLAIARVLLSDPDLLLIDEPTEGLAPIIVDDLFRLMGEIKQRGQSILLVEQNVPRALKLCDRFYAMERGQVVLEGRAGDAGDEERLMEAITM
ncbi:ABC transporter ATP-binding protein [Paracandidimonas soli]|uniref:Amino acid/amide ABC transporter ATP-binding protein 2 (HAAT family) n=1 Tax=Paracandidimonas soli TaxID=1917182 RepID=A0A4R3VDY4_9BURK|nr:ABC transporter ATP-binding protein [Paracandidimonas soli]TCV01894.1 amino acid/amide ABC transporter ATP-binding protein 2 (HAAT family) [Paracandidimonas soli]